MKIEDIDKNFIVGTETGESGLTYANALSPLFSLHGLTYDHAQNRYVRMPQHVADSVSGGVAALSRHTSGGRLRFKTNSIQVAVQVELGSVSVMNHMPQLGICGFSLYVDGVFFKPFIPPVNCVRNDLKEYNGVIAFPDDREREITLYFPLYNEVRSLAIGLTQGSEVKPPKAFKNQKPILFYGSSITQGGCASRPGNSYDAILCGKLGYDYVNLGFSGNAKGEPVMAEYLAGLDVSMFVYDYDHNAPTVEHLQNTHFAFYRIYREKRPETPIIFLSKPGFENGIEQNRIRRDIIRETFRKAGASGDTNICFVDGEGLFGRDCRDACTVDGCHPNDLGFYRMADHLYEKVLPFLRN